MTITYRDQLSRDLTPSEVDANFRHALDSANQSFTASGSGAITSDVQTQLRLKKYLSNYNTLQDAITAAQTAKQELVIDADATSTPVTISAPLKVTWEPGRVITASMTAAQTGFITMTSGDVELIRPRISGSSLVALNTANKYMILKAAASGTLKNFRIYKPVITDCTATDSDLLVCHGIYIDDAEYVEIDIEKIDNVSGAAVFWRDVIHGDLGHGLIDNTGWYSVTLDSGCEHFDLHHLNIASSVLTTGRLFGGSINLMSLQTSTKNKHGRVAFCRASGKHNYGAVFRLLSCDDLEVRENEATNCTIGNSAHASAVADVLHTFFVGTRGVSAGDKQEPGSNIRILNNKAIAAEESDSFIYVSNEFQTANPVIGVKVNGNKCESPDTSNFFKEGIIFRGLSGGIKDIEAFGNEVETKLIATAIVGGALGFGAADADGLIHNVRLGGNTLVDIGTPSTSVQAGLLLGAYVNNVRQIAPNRIANMFYGVRQLTNCGTDIQGVTDQIYESCTNASLCVQITFNPADLADGAGETTTAITPGAAFLKPVIGSFSLDLQGIIATYYASAANVVSARFQNETTGSINLGSGRLRRMIVQESDAKLGQITTPLIFSTTNDPASLADGAGVTVAITATGASLGDLVVPFFGADLQGITATAYVSAANVIRIRLQNETGGPIDLGSMTFGAYVLKIIPGQYVTAAYTPSSLNDGLGETTTVTVPGAELGDFAVASFSLDLANTILTAYVSAANTVSVRLQNESGSTYNPGAGTLAVQIYKAKPWS